MWSVILLWGVWHAIPPSLALVGSVTPPYPTPPVILWHVGKSWHNDHGLSVILGRIESNLPIQIHIVILTLSLNFFDQTWWQIFFCYTPPPIQKSFDTPVAYTSYSTWVITVAVQRVVPWTACDESKIAILFCVSWFSHYAFEFANWDRIRWFCILQPALCTLNPELCTLHPELCTLHPISPSASHTTCPVTGALKIWGLLCPLNVHRESDIVASTQLGIFMGLSLIHIRGILKISWRGYSLEKILFRFINEEVLQDSSWFRYFQA